MCYALYIPLYYLVSILTSNKELERNRTVCNSLEYFPLWELVAWTPTEQMLLPNFAFDVIYTGNKKIVIKKYFDDV